MAIDPSIPLQTKPVDATGTIGGLLGLKQQVVNIERSQSETKQTQQTERQRADLAKVFSEFDWQKGVGDDGILDVNKLVDAGLLKAAGDSAPQALQSVAGLIQQQISAKQTLVQLRDTQRNSFGQMLGALRSDPDVAQDTAAGRQKVAETFAQYAEQYGSDVEPVLKAYAGPLQNAPPGKLAQVVQNIQLQATSASDQATRQAPQFTNTGSELKQTNPYAQEGQAPGSIPLTVAPGEQSQVFTGQDGRQYEMRRDPKGNIKTFRALGEASDGADSGGIIAYGPGELKAQESQAEQNFVNVAKNREAASLAPQQLDQIRKAKELSKQVSTGKWSAQRAGIESGLSSLIPGLSAAQDDATKLQELDKFLERVAATSSQVLGVSASTDAARESISKQNASIGYTPQAIQAVLDYAEAQTSAMSAKGDAQEKWLKQKGNGITKQHDFETAWRQSYDPLVFQLDVASPEERQKIVNKLSKGQAAELKAKRGKLRELGAIK